MGYFGRGGIIGTNATKPGNFCCLALKFLVEKAEVLEDVLAGELHLARLDEKTAAAADVGAEIGAGAVGLQRVGGATGWGRVEAVGIENVEDLYRDAELVFVEDMEVLGDTVVHGEVAVGAVVVTLAALAYVGESQVGVSIGGGDSVEGGFDLIDGVVVMTTCGDFAGCHHIAVEGEVGSPIAGGDRTVWEAGAVVDETVQLEATEDTICPTAVVQ